MVHLAYCDNKEKELDRIIAHEKTMVIRAAAGRKLPHSRVFEHETIYFMEKGSGMITAMATVTHVENYVKLDLEESMQIMLRNQDKLKLSEKQLQRWNKKAMILVEFENAHEIKPLPFDKQGNMDDWLIIDKIEDVVVGTSIKYNYEKTKLS